MLQSLATIHLSPSCHRQLTIVSGIFRDPGGGLFRKGASSLLTFSMWRSSLAYAFRSALQQQTVHTLSNQWISEKAGLDISMQWPTAQDIILRCTGDLHVSNRCTEVQVYYHVHYIAASTLVIWYTKTRPRIGLGSHTLCREEGFGHAATINLSPRQKPVTNEFMLFIALSWSGNYGTMRLAYYLTAMLNLIIGFLDDKLCVSCSVTRLFLSLQRVSLARLV